MAQSSASAAMCANDIAPPKRVDPWQLPQITHYERSNRAGDMIVPVNAAINTDCAVIKRDLGCGAPLSVSLPMEVFKGIAATAIENEDGTTNVTLQLLHEDTELSIPLYEGTDLDEAAADWHSWARRTNLPMLLINEEGHAIAVKEASALTSRASKPRRRRISAIKHRPNFLRRRQMGRIGPVVEIPVAELIARA